MMLRELRVFGVLLCHDLSLLRYSLLNRLINMCAWVTANIIVAGYVFPELGMMRQFGMFLLAGLFASIGFFELYGRVAELVRDMSGDKAILYYATLPISVRLFVIRLVLNGALTSTIVGLAILPFGKLLLGNEFSISAVRWGYLCLMMLLANFLYSAAAVLIATFIYRIENISNVWIRIAYPLWFVGCYQFSYQALKQALPTLAWINLANPAVYVAEGMRAALIGQEGFVPIGLCCGVVALAGVICTGASIMSLRSRLDLV
jgi:ABC-2 type transport system permease protein